ncbi:hypothetical protein [uncultured Agitococcus sp.]|uniref:hypothetical protein n=1 Tax=uncultured Agitococcus sp. TaxID=1506599 RepID=UPI0026295926|nr:hypothetical protein [uncultured Agitococcus sp.]
MTVKTPCPRAIAHLQQLLEGKKIYLTLMSVSSTGMSRKFKCLAVNNGDIVNIGYDVAHALAYRYDDDHNVIIKGCNMDMAFALTYNLSCALFDDGYKLKHSTI